MRFLFIALLLCSLTAIAEEADTKKIDAAIRDLSDDSFDTRQSAERTILDLINSGLQSEVQQALKAAVENQKSNAELKSRASKLLQLCDVTVSEGLAARLLVKPIQSDSMLHLAEPFADLPQIIFRVTNASGKAFQVAHASYPVYEFFRFEVVRLEEDGKKRVPIKPYFDLYPFKDMRAPNKVFTTLQPGESFERDMKTLLKEGYLMVSLNGRANQDEKHEFGLMRAAGTYEITGVYCISPRYGDTHFESVLERDARFPLWTGTIIKTKPVFLKVGN